MRYIFLILISSSLYFSDVQSAPSPWGENYFPNSVLTSHEGKKVRFFDDLIKDKVVAINFIYTTCPDTCPLETAQLARVQKIMGDRLGKDVFFYSISIDPDKDTPEVLSQYRKKFNAKWDFFTGNEKDIIEIRQKLGLYIEEIQDGSNNHNVNMIIGNQKTGRWMKRSPFENAHVLADQLGNWLTGWKAAPKGGNYADAPELRNISAGEQLFRTRCTTCHTVTGVEPKDAIGPDLLNISDKRPLKWLMDWLRAPDQMLKNKDPIAMALYEKYNRVAMPNMRLNQIEAMSILDYINEESTRLNSAQKKAASSTEDVVAVMNAWIRKAMPGDQVNAGYITMFNMDSSPVTLIKIESQQFEKVEFHEMTHENGMMKMHELERVEIPANNAIKFAPGGKHLMLKNPLQSIDLDNSVTLKLIFSDNRTQTITLTVKDK